VRTTEVKGTEFFKDGGIEGHDTTMGKSR